MRLLNVRSLVLEEFVGDKVPDYSILSHTWGIEEISFHEIQHASKEDLEKKKGGRKILASCEIAKAFNEDYIWIDTCCIDKSSSAELSEAINSMFRWYKLARNCFVHLEDVALENISTGKDLSSRWFTRGWTLQELLAPSDVTFFNKKWAKIGTRRTLWKFISYCTGIAPLFLWNFRAASVAQRLSWAAERETTRGEDTAYCLLGLFDVNMPLLYGEGAVKAFKRLQVEIINSTEDQSILAWNDLSGTVSTDILADSAQSFRGCANIFRGQSATLASFTFANAYLHLKFRSNPPLADVRDCVIFDWRAQSSYPLDMWPNAYAARLIFLNCAYYESTKDYQSLCMIVIPTEGLNKEGFLYRRFFVVRIRQELSETCQKQVPQSVLNSGHLEGLYGDHTIGPSRRTGDKTLQTWFGNIIKGFSYTKQSDDLTKLTLTDWSYGLDLMGRDYNPNVEPIWFEGLDTENCPGVEKESAEMRAGLVIDSTCKFNTILHET